MLIFAQYCNDRQENLTLVGQPVRWGRFFKFSLEEEDLGTVKKCQ